MSLGYGGWCFIADRDDECVIYQYGSFNLNEPQYQNKDKICDGLITIKLSSLVEPEIHKKTKRFPNGKKKLIVKRIEIPVPYYELLKSGEIHIQNCSNCWHILDDGTDYIARYLVHCIFSEYQQNGAISDKIAFHV